MKDFLYAIPVGLLVLGVLVLVHEFGHFAVAKLCKVRVETFSLGFGKRILGFRRGGTDYRISAIPLGGYVKMAGENPMEDHTGAPDEFSSHPRWQRFLIAIAGPTMNILLSIVVLTGVYMWHFPKDFMLDPPVVGYVDKGSPADKAGAQIGDKILRVENVATSRWEDVLNQFQLTGSTVHITVERDGKSQELSLVKGYPADSDDEGEGDAKQILGLWQQETLVVSTLEASMPAIKAGLKPGDKVLSVDGSTPHSMEAIKQRIQDVQAKPISMTVENGEKTRTLSITPIFDPEVKRYRIGFDATWTQDKKLPFPEAFLQSLDDNRKTSLLIVRFLQRIVQHPVAAKKMNSVITIVDVSGQAAKRGWPVLLSVMAMISVNLGIFNLLPIPILDGGVILLLFVEGALRRNLNRELKERIYQAAFVFLLLFAAFVIFHDVARYAHKFFG